MGQRLGVKDMTEPAWQASHSDGRIKQTTRQGNRAIKMPAFGADKFDDKALDDLVAYMRKLKR